MNTREWIHVITSGGLTRGRVWRAALRRAAALPDNVSYAIHSGRGSQNWLRIRARKDAHAGERCFVLGNGPSLARTDLSRVAGEWTFGTNRVYLAFEEGGFRPNYYVCMNELVIKQSAEEIGRIGLPKFLNWRQRSLFAGDENAMLLRESFWPEFSRDLTRGIWGGATVTYAALQIAHYMGFRQVVLIGVDHSYTASGTPHSTAVASGPDRDHFHPAYFTDGFRWQLPDLATSEFAYRLAREAFEADGREILDATLGGNLQVFPKVAFDSLVS